MACEGAPPELLISSRELRAAIGGEAAAVTRLVTAVCAWLGSQPQAAWQAFVARHPHDAVPTDAMVVHQIRSVMIVRQLPEPRAAGLPRPPERVVAAAEAWIYAHTNQWFERGVQRQFFVNASRFVARCSETQVKEHRKDATQNAWESFLRKGCAAWDPAGGASLRTWAFRIGSLRAIDYVRRLLQGPESMSFEEEVYPMAMPRDDLCGLGIQDWELERFKGTLGPYQRRLYELYFDPFGVGLTGAEIAKLVGKTTTAVHRMLAEVARKLELFFSETKGEEGAHAHG